MNYKVNFFRTDIFPKILSLYRISEKWPNGFGHFSAFFELWTVFWAVLRYPSGKCIKKRVALGNSLNFSKKNENPNIDIWVPKMVFPKCTFSGPKLSRRGVVWYLLNSLKARARASRGLDNWREGLVVERSLRRHLWIGL